MTTTLEDEDLRALLSELVPAAAGPATIRRRPLHVLYGGAQRFKPTTPSRVAELAREALDAWIPDPAALTEIVGVDLGLAERALPKIRRKVALAPIEDLRIDFEDGYGERSDDEEDADAIRAGRSVAEAHLAGELPESVGLRLRPMRERGRRALATLDRFFTALASTLEERAASDAPRITVTLPKVEHHSEVEVLARALDRLDALVSNGRPAVIEVMAESAPALLNERGFTLPRLIEAGDGRVESVHFGTYDFASSLQVTAPHQRADHPACDQARLLMKLLCAPLDVEVSDGATHTLPLPKHRGDALTNAQREENAAHIRGALSLHAHNVRRALEAGIYRGWDLHPTQVAARWATVIPFFLNDVDSQIQRMAGFTSRANTGALDGGEWVDAAAARGLLVTLLRGAQAGALDDADLARAGITEAMRRSGSVVSE